MHLFPKNFESERFSNKTIYQLLFTSWFFKLFLGFVLILFTNNIPNDFSSFAKLYCYNDSGWYQKIAENWYLNLTDKSGLGYLDETSKEQSSWAFFPLYPLLVKGLMTLLTCDFYIASFILSLILLPLALILFFKLVLIFNRDLKFAWLTTFLLIIMPFHYQLFMSYTEALFLVGLFASVLGIFIKHPGLIIIGTSILVLTRPNGVLTLIPLWLLQLEQAAILWKTFIKQVSIIIKKSFVFMPAALVFIGYLFYQYKMTGYFNAFTMAQKGWGKEFMLPFFAFFRYSSLENQVNSIYCIIVMLFAVWHIRRMPLSLNFLVWLNILLPLTAGSTISMGRYLIVLFPLLILFSEKLYIYPRMKFVAIVLLLSCQIYFLQYWTMGNSMGY